MLIEGNVGISAPVADGTEVSFRLGRDREIVTVDGRGRYAEAASRNQIFTAMTAPTGTTVAAANLTPIAAGVASIFSIYNPLGSGVNAEIIKTWLAFISGTTPNAVGLGIPYNYALNQNISATPNNGNTSGSLPVSTYTGITGKVKAFTQTALTGGVGAQVFLRLITTLIQNLAIASTTYNQNVVDQVDGEIIIPPGGLLSVAGPSAGAGTNLVIAVGMTWQETPILTS